MMDAQVGACDEVCDELGGTLRVFVEPGCTLSRPLSGHGYSGLGRDISCRMPTHSVCHDLIHQALCRGGEDNVTVIVVACKPFADTGV